MGYLKKLLLQLLLPLLLLPISIASAEFSVPHVIVYGTAETEVIPDKLLWSTSLKNQGGTITDVADEHARAVSNVLAYLYESGIPQKQVKTSRIRLQENYVYRNNQRLKEGYYAQTQITFETTDFKTYLDYWKKLSTFNQLTINSVTFDISNRIEIQDQTRIAAVVKAREKAVKLAEAMATRIIEPLLIEEIHGYSPSVRNNVVLMEASGGARGPEPISPGKETVRAKVKTIFRIMNEE